ncbi:SWIM zinc finger family protein [Streptomyces sp. NPDC088353]|uniref:SWIM zinc finger family protein n=1 Tax=Streptomyces sp. NPDC088353 TaxID=3365855 RepID=UPI00380A477E
MAGTHAGASTGPFRTPPAALGHAANADGNSPTDQMSEGASECAPDAPTAAPRHGASAGTLGAPSVATGEGVPDGVLAGAPGAPSAAMRDSASAGTPEAPSATTGDGVSLGAPDAPWAGTPGAPSASAPEAASARRRAYGRQAPPSSAGAGSGSASFSPARDGAEPPVPPRVPRTMASPRRDGGLRRTFPAFPARAVEGERFAETWWGDAWVDALEEGALDAARLARGRGYAQTGHVDAVTVTPGLVLAYVQGSRPRPYRVQVRLRTLDDADWDRFLDAVAERPGHIAALLDKEMPQSLADCGVPLLPGPGDLEPHCSCPDHGHPCKHAAALCYQTARLLDADPFVLLLLRGRGERELLDALSRLNATRAARAAQEREPEPFPGVRAGEALAARRRPPLPAPLPAPPHPEQPPVYPAAPGGPDPFVLDQLATDAAARAHALLTTGRDPVGGLTLWQDAVRLAAARPGSGLTAATRSLYASLASATGRGTAELARAVAAWRQGGPEGLAVLEEPWDPPAGRFDRARPLLLAADLPAFRPWRNRLTHPRGHLQLRLGRDGLWYAYESEPDRDDWWPRGTPDLDPVGALTGLGAPGAL